VTSSFLAAACACLCAWPALALVTRTDRDDAEYLELASHYTSALRLTAPAGEGVLIAPRWILTSAARSKAPARVRIGERDHAIQATYAHAESGVALLLLKEEVTAAEATPIYRGADEAGKGVVIAGHGGDGRRRAGINTVDRVDARTLEVRIKKGDDASDLQGALTPAEIGAPAYLQVEGRRFVAGIATTIAGDRETYARVSALADWIDGTMFRAAADEARGPVTPPARRR
jgi:hypothetical protein